MELLKVKTEDVYPDEANPRQTFSGIDEMAASFDLNVERPGEPFIPPLLVRDGGIYRIVDGERRYRALKARKAKEFWANVCESMDEADTVTAMLATDDKAPLTDLERSRGAQRMLLLGVDPVKVEKAARFKGAERLAAVMAKADDAAEDLTLDRALAASDFLDDDEAFNELMTCKESEWRWKASSFKEKKAKEARIAEMTAVAFAHGVEVVTSVDYRKKTDVGGRCENAAALEELLDGLDPALGLPVMRFGYYGEAWVYVDRTADAEAAAAEAEEKAKAKELADSFAATFSAIRSYFWSHAKVKKNRGKGELQTLAFDRFKDEFLDDCLADFPDLVAEDPSLMDIVIGYDIAFPWRGLSVDKARGIAEGAGLWCSDVPEMADLFAAAAADGFEFEEAMLPAKAAVEAAMAGGE